jgi:ABC-2 type transport system ATP-binding protein
VGEPIVDRSTPAPAAHEDVVAVANLSRSYGAVRAVTDVSFVVRRGEVFGLLGPNGAGKTSTIEILAGFRRHDAGIVRVLGLDPGTRSDLRELRRRAAIVPQAAGHYRYLRVRETLEMHHALHEQPRDVDEVLALVGLEDMAQREVRRLSGGQQRRLDVGVAVIGRPELVLLDEPTTGFDPAARRRAWELVEQLRALGTSVLLTTHYMEEAQALADRVAVMRRGVVVGMGTPTELAEQLRLPSTIRFRVPAGVGVSDLPGAVRAMPGVNPDAAVGDLVCGQAQTPTRIMGVLCGWAAERGVELEQLELRQPGLEESYLALTADDADEGQLPGADVSAAATGSRRRRGRRAR